MAEDRHPPSLNMVSGHAPSVAAREEATMNACPTVPSRDALAPCRTSPRLQRALAHARTLLARRAQRPDAPLGFQWADDEPPEAQQIGAWFAPTTDVALMLPTLVLDAG